MDSNTLVSLVLGPVVRLSASGGRQIGRLATSQKSFSGTTTRLGVAVQTGWTTRASVEDCGCRREDGPVARPRVDGGPWAQGGETQRTLQPQGGEYRRLGSEAEKAAHGALARDSN